MNKDIYPVSTDIGEYKVWLPLAEQDYIQKTIASSGHPYEYKTLVESLRWIPKGGTVLDAGGNIGNHALFWALYGAKVEYFEPFEKLVSIAMKNFELNSVADLINIHRAALGDAPGKAHLVSADETNLGTTKITPAHDGSVIIRRVDDFKIESLDFLKIDVEGYELNVLNGAKETIERTRPVVLVETIDLEALEQVSEFFLPRHYLFWDMYNATPTQLLVPMESVNFSAVLQNSMEQMIKRFKQKEMHEECLVKLRGASEKYRNATQRIKDLTEESKHSPVSGPIPG